MKKLILITPLLCLSATIFLSACAHDEPVSQTTTTTTRETTVQQPAASSTTTTTHSTGY